MSGDQCSGGGDKKYKRGRLIPVRTSFSRAAELHSVRRAVEMGGEVKLPGIGIKLGKFFAWLSYDSTYRQFVIADEFYFIYHNASRRFA